METKKYLLIFDDFSLKVVEKIDDSLMDSGYDGDVVIVDITGAKDPREMAFLDNEFEWWSIKDESEPSD